MKRLYIVRHAKSSWKDLSLDDFDRPLNKRGRRDAPTMGARLRERGVKPDIMISSPALRTKLTAQSIAKEVGYSKKIVFNKNIYELYVADLHEILKDVDDSHSIAFLFGHDTGLNMLAKKYVDMDENIVTCGVVEIEFDCESWSDIGRKNAKFISYDYPKKGSDLI